MRERCAENINFVLYFTIIVIGLLIFFLLSKSDIPHFDGYYVILDTDYVTYTVETKCTDLAGGGSIGE